MGNGKRKEGMSLTIASLVWSQSVKSAHWLLALQDFLAGQALVPSLIAQSKHEGRHNA